MPDFDVDTEWFLAHLEVNQSHYAAAGVASRASVSSKDGKMIRTTLKGTDDQGKSFETVELWEGM